MILLAMVSLLVGALLAQRFKVLVLIPATAIVLGVALGTGVTHAHSAWSMILTVGMAATSIQIGYLIIGSGVRRVWAGVVTSRSSHIPSTTSAQYNATLNAFAYRKRLSRPGVILSGICAQARAFRLRRP